MAEALALQRAVSIAGDQGFEKVIFASDCLSLIQRLKSTEPDWSQIGSVVLDIKQRVAGFSPTTFRHVNRLFNKEAHILARSYDVYSLALFLVLFQSAFGEQFVLMLCDQ
jgi:hypothetical protein